MNSFTDLLKAFVLMVAGIFLLSIIIGAIFSYGFSSQHFALVKLNGELVTETSTGLFSSPQMSSDEIVPIIKSLNNNPSVLGVIFEINSPGGSVVAGQEIYNAILALEKPKVAYIREVGASGGYYIALGADKIFANANAMTGSIGAVIYLTEMAGLFEKLGINYTVVKSGEMKDIGIQSRQITDEERLVLQEMVDESFNEFKNIIIERRPNMNLQDFEVVLDGRVISGRKAKQLGLIDDIGTMEIALEELATLSNSSQDTQIVIYNKKETNIFSMLLNKFVSEINLNSNSKLKIE